jgi:predicted esterase
MLGRPRRLEHAALLTAVTLSVVPGDSLAQTDRLPRGEIIERVVSLSDSTQSYALYLPSDYGTHTRWPVLIVMDPRGRAVTSLRLFQAAAERHGYVVLSSYDTRSDETVQPNELAMQAMLGDVQQIIAVDVRRLYLAGFSGTARIGWLFADQLAGHVAGLIGFGGGQPGGALLTLFEPETSLGFFGGAGTTDFNYEEMRALDKWLDQLGLPHRFEYFDGPHSWPPEELCSRALDWMQLRAMKTGLHPRDDAWLESLFGDRLEEARALETSGELYEAFIRYRAISEDFAGLLDIADVAVKTAELERDGRVRRTVRRMDDLAEWQSDYDDQTFFPFIEMYRTTRGLPSLERATKSLKIEELERRAAEAEDQLESEAAVRVLEHVFVRTAFYEPEDFMGQGEFERALGIALIAGRIKPEHPYVCLGVARAQAQLGQVEEALRALECLVASGATSADFLGQDPYLEPLRGEPAYREILARLEGGGQGG